MVRPHNDKSLQGLELELIGTAGFEPATPLNPISVVKLLLSDKLPEFRHLPDRHVGPAGRRIGPGRAKLVAKVVAPSTYHAPDHSNATSDVDQRLDIVFARAGSAPDSDTSDRVRNHGKLASAE